MIGRKAPAVRLVIAVVACYAWVEHLAHASSQVTVLLEVLRHGGEVAGMVSPVGVEVIESGGVRTSRCEKGGSARATDGLLSISSSENCSLAR